MSDRARFLLAFWSMVVSGLACLAVIALLLTTPAHAAPPPFRCDATTCVLQGPGGNLEAFIAWGAINRTKLFITLPYPGGDPRGIKAFWTRLGHFPPGACYSACAVFAGMLPRMGYRMRFDPTTVFSYGHALRDRVPDTLGILGGRTYADQLARSRAALSPSWFAWLNRDLGHHFTTKGPVD